MSSLFRQTLSRVDFLVLVVVALGLLNHPDTQAAQPETVAYKHAYYLFLDGAGTGCQSCYVPLLITQNSLEKIGAAGKGEEGVLIITYERDSIWQNKGTVHLHAEQIEAVPRIVRLNVNRYRYQEISAAETIKLLENPGGTIPISRTSVQGMDLGKPTLEELISAFKSLQ
ncbi:MAG TPA: hypothetical protein VKH81_08965 [Candidatus Angelobacter sp.]|nr:hypothetical protein [Candidatus Angelobacter sp.]